MQVMETRRLSLGVVQEVVVLPMEPIPRRGAGGGVCPNDFVPVVLAAEYRVHQDAEVGVGVPIAVEVNAAGRLQHAAHLGEADAHKHGVGRHRRLLARLQANPAQAVAQLAVRQPVERVLRLHRPAPDVAQLARHHALVPERRDVELVGVEGRVEVDEVDALVRQLAEGGVVVAAHERVAREVAVLGHCKNPPV